VTAKVEHEGSGYWVTQARCEAGGKPVADAQIMACAPAPIRAETMRRNLREFADRIGMPLIQKSSHPAILLRQGFGDEGRG